MSENFKEFGCPLCVVLEITKLASIFDRKCPTLPCLNIANVILFGVQADSLSSLPPSVLFLSIFLSSYCHSVLFFLSIRYKTVG